MEIKDVIGKIAYSKDGKKIGEIRAAKVTMEKRLNESIKYILFQQNRFFKKPFFVAIELTDGARIEGEKVILDITKEEYREAVRRVRVQRQYMADQAKLQEATNTQKAASIALSWGKL
ncbi:MAG: PRC-barrel domain-containing protein [Candidatus Heimdallarchaeota archaeon]